MRTELIEIKGDRGLHATPAAMFAQTAMKFKSDIRVGYYELGGSDMRDAKNLIAVYSLGGKKGLLRVEIEGEDENEAMEELLILVASNFKGEG